VIKVLCLFNPFPFPLAQVMAAYRQRVIALTKRQGHTFGFMLRVEQGEAGHLVHSLDMGGPAALAGMKDGDRMLRVNGNFVDGLSHQKVLKAEACGLLWSRNDNHHFGSEPSFALCLSWIRWWTS